MAPPEAKPVPSGVQMEYGGAYSSTPAMAPSDPFAVLNYILRFAAVVLALLAAIVLGTAKQTSTAIVSDEILGTGVFRVTAKAIDLSATKYFVAANVIVAAYTIGSLALSVITRGASRSLPLLLTLADVVALALLFSANGAAAEVAIVLRNGEGGTWEKLCGMAGKVCDRFTASIVLSMLAAVAYVVLVFFSVLAAHKRAQP